MFLVALLSLRQHQLSEPALRLLIGSLRPRIPIHDQTSDGTDGSGDSAHERPDAAVVTSSGGREGHVRSSDGVLDLPLSMPKELGGSGKHGTTNPERLFAPATPPVSSTPCCASPGNGR
jgi:hypothetical protein